MIGSIDKQVAELRHNLARQPGPDIIDEARSLKVELQKKVKVIQSLTAERNMYITDNEQVRLRLGLHHTHHVRAGTDNSLMSKDF